jgi:hypothetical protein
MPASERPWPQNVGDYARAQLSDLGVPWVDHLAPLAGVAAVGTLFAGLFIAWWRSRRDPPVHLRLTVLGGYALGGAVLLIVSRSRYEWGNLIDERNVLQYTFALVLALVVAGGVALAGRARRIAGAACLLLLALGLAGAAREAVALHHAPKELWRALADEPAVIAAARDLPAATLIGSNFSVLFRIGAGRAVRQVDVSGSDADFAGSLADFARHADGRPPVFVLVCDGEWTRGFSACQRVPSGEGPACMRLAVRPVVVARCVPGAGRPP